MSGGGRTIWMSVDVAIMRRERNAALLLEVGPDAWAFIFCLWLMAKEQRSTTGLVKFGHTNVAMATRLRPSRVAELVDAAEAAGVIRGLVNEDGVLEAVLTDFIKDDRRGRAASRKAAERDRRDRDGEPQAVTERDSDWSQDDGVERDTTPDSGPDSVTTPAVVTERHPRVEERREEPSYGGGAGGESRPPVQRPSTPSAILDQHQLPSGLTEQQATAAVHVHAALCALHPKVCRDGAAPPSLFLAGLALRDFPHLDHSALLLKVESWMHGPEGIKAVRRGRTDIGGLYRKFCETADEKRRGGVRTAAARGREVVQSGADVLAAREARRQRPEGAAA